jgi:uncharacterized repeat protein (TIGR03803 family)
MDIVYRFPKGAPTAKLVYRAPYFYGIIESSIFKIHESGYDFMILRSDVEGDLVLDNNYLYGLTDSSLFRMKLDTYAQEVLYTCKNPVALTVKDHIYLVTDTSLISMGLDGSDPQTQILEETPTGIDDYITTSRSIYRYDGTLVYTSEINININPGLCELDGDIYGTTTKGGDYNRGTIFSVNRGILHSFGAEGDGYYPQRGLVAWNGYLYGATLFGGMNRQGVFYRIKEAYTILYQFRDEYAMPYGNMTLVKDMLYTCTKCGIGGGTILRFTLPTIWFAAGTKILGPTGEVRIEDMNSSRVLVESPTYSAVREGFEPLVIMADPHMITDEFVLINKKCAFYHIALDGFYANGFFIAPVGVHLAAS